MKKLNDALAQTLSFLPDRSFSVLTFLLKHRRLPNLKSPIYFNEKLLNLKLTDRNPINREVVDKYNVRNYIEKNIGASYLIPLIGVYDSVEEIPWSDLPNKFALKVTNGSQHNLICTDKSRLNFETVKKDLDKWLKLDFYKRTREWPYKDNRARIIVEKYMADNDGELKDYKFWCFRGEPEFVQIDSTRFSDHRRDFYDISWKEKISMEVSYPPSDSNVSKPENYEELVMLAKKLSQDFEFVRIDLYNIDGKIYFGEITFYPGNCNERITPLKYEEKIGSLL